MKQWQIYLILAAIVLSIGIFGGWTIRKNTHHCPAITRDTIRIWDTVEHHIIDAVPYYVTHIDTVIKRDTLKIPVILTKADTLRILTDYYALHIYDRKWLAKDTLEVNIKDFITENKSIKNEFTYKILRPQTIIQNITDNSVTVNRYINIGLTIPFKQPNLGTIDASFIGERYTYGIKYGIHENAWSASVGVNIFKLKKTKKGP
jgi:hypothetical protein